MTPPPYHARSLKGAQREVRQLRKQLKERTELLERYAGTLYALEVVTRRLLDGRLRWEWLPSHTSGEWCYDGIRYSASINTTNGIPEIPQILLNHIRKGPA